jgi:hypothetical protein
MGYDRTLLKSWAEMETWDQCLEREGALNKYSSQEGFVHVQKKYFFLLDERIQYCRKLLKDYQDAFLYYVIAELYDRTDLNQSPAYLYKRHTRFYASKALELDPNYAPARALLDKANEWIEYLGGDKNYMPDFEVQFSNMEIKINVDKDQNL